MSWRNSISKRARLKSSFLEPQSDKKSKSKKRQSSFEENYSNEIILFIFIKLFSNCKTQLIEDIVKKIIIENFFRRKIILV
jgi:hypothetical protein